MIQILSHRCRHIGISVRKRFYSRYKIADYLAEWITTEVSYGLFLSDHLILDIVESELVIMPAIMCQNLRGPTYWHLRACLRIGMSVEEVEQVQAVIKSAAALVGRSLDVQRARDVTDV